MPKTNISGKQILDASVDLTVDVAGTLPIANGGTGATDAASARAALGAGTSNLAIGTTGTTAAAGNDSRLSDTRTPTDNTVTSAKIVDGSIVDADVNAAAGIVKTKLASAVQTSLGKADSAVQPAASGSVVVGTLPGSGVTGVLYVVP